MNENRGEYLVFALYALANPDNIPYNIRSQKPEARSQKPEARSQKPEARSQTSYTLTHSWRGFFLSFGSFFLPNRSTVFFQPVIHRTRYEREGGFAVPANAPLTRARMVRSPQTRSSPCPTDGGGCFCEDKTQVRM
jgi:hypothetical protein